MRKIRFILLLALVFICTVFPLSAFDWGGFFSADAGIKGPANADLIKKFTQSDRLTLWLRTPLPRLKGSYFAAEGFYSFAYSGEKKEASHIIDVSLLKFSIPLNLGSLRMTVNAGRFGFSDLSGFFFMQNADGAELLVNSNRFSSKVYMGYTGILNAHTTYMSLGGAEHKDYVYDRAPDALLGGVFFSFPHLFAQQTLACEAGFAGSFKDMAAFFGTSLNGPLISAIFYSASSLFAVSQANVSNISRFEITAYLPYLSSLVAWNTVFATAQAGKIGDFNSFSVTSADVSGSLKYAGNIKTGLTGSIKPHPSLLCTLNGDLFFNVMDTASAKGFSGVQWQTAVRWHVFSDLQFSVSAGQFFAASNKMAEPYTLAVIKLLYSF